MPGRRAGHFRISLGHAMSHAISPLAPKYVPEMPEIPGVRLATGAAGIKYKGRTDVLLALFDKGTTVAGVLTRSKCPSAPVEWCRAILTGGDARALGVSWTIARQRWRGRGARQGAFGRCRHWRCWRWRRAGVR